MSEHAFWKTKTAGEVRGPAAERESRAIEVDRAAAEEGAVPSRGTRAGRCDVERSRARLRRDVAAEIGGAGQIDGPGAGLDQPARRRSLAVQQAAAVDRAGNGRRAGAAEGQIADDRMQRAADGQGLAGSHVPGLRAADIDVGTERDAFVGLDAAGRDRQRAAAERVAGGLRS